MSNLRSIVCCSRKLLLITLVLSLNACNNGSSSSSEPEETTAQPPTVEPRFDSAKALLEHYNQIAMRQPQANPAEIFSLLYAETPKQEQIVRIYKNSLPLMELDALCWEKFGAGMQKDSKESPFTTARNPAIMTESDPERAKARLKENDGQYTDLYLVKYNERWWISGLTLENDKKINNDDVDLDLMERAMDYFSTSAPKVISEIESGTGINFADYGEEAPQVVYMRLVAHVLRDYPEAEDMRDFFGVPED